MRPETYIPCDILQPYVQSFAIHDVADQRTYKVLPGTGLVIGFQYKGRLSYLDNKNEIFRLSVGSLFAIAGNKYIIDSSLPESASFTLVDTLHGLTLFSIFIIITATSYSLHLMKKVETKKARRFDMTVAKILLTLYVILNIWFILQAGWD